MLELARTFERDVALRDGLLPFVDGGSLERYRLALLAYLGKGAPSCVAPLHEEAVAYVGRKSVAEFRERAVEESVKVVGDYLAGNVVRPPRGSSQ